jgi:hypothetical protein
LAVNSAEDWIRGTEFDVTNEAFGTGELLMVVGGTNANITYGMGRWH